jgi:hypothetical protein
MDARSIRLIDGATREFVAADLHLRFPAERVSATEAVWKPHRDALGDEIEHGHWDWHLKSGLLVNPTIRCFAVECGTAIQGMLMLEEVGKIARHSAERGLPLVFVDYLEAAPWNVRLAVQNPRFRNVGLHLLRAAVELSLELGYRGRVGLHSLPRAEGFYERGCGMFAIGQDPEYNGLMYYEFTPELAERLLRGGQT